MEDARIWKPMEDTRTPAMGGSWKTGLSSVFVQRIGQYMKAWHITSMYTYSVSYVKRMADRFAHFPAENQLQAAFPAHTEEGTDAALSVAALCTGQDPKPGDDAAPNGKNVFLKFQDSPPQANLIYNPSLRPSSLGILDRVKLTIKTYHTLAVKFVF
ncbi:hypothetical protein STEG23_010838 [Scotinomys teguina]